MFLHRIKAALLGVAIAATTVLPSFALVTDPAVIAGRKIIPERTCERSQNLCYIRVTINFNDNSITNGVWAFTLPANAYVTQMLADVTTAFNAGTTNNLTIGATATGTDFLAATSIASTGLLSLGTAAGQALGATGVTANQTAINGGVPVYVRYVTGGTAATAGSVTIVIAFAKNDDK